MIIIITVIITAIATGIFASRLASHRYEQSEKKWVALHQELPDIINLTSLQQWLAVEKKMRDAIFPPYTQLYFKDGDCDVREYYKYSSLNHDVLSSLWEKKEIYNKYKYFQKKQPKDIQELFTHIQFYGYEIHIQHKDDTSRF